MKDAFSGVRNPAKNSYKIIGQDFAIILLSNEYNLLFYKILELLNNLLSVYSSLQVSCLLCNLLTMITSQTEVPNHVMAHLVTMVTMVNAAMMLSL